MPLAGTVRVTVVSQESCPPVVQTLNEDGLVGFGRGYIHGVDGGIGRYGGDS
jgi:hypothetical protein